MQTHTQRNMTASIFDKKDNKRTLGRNEYQKTNSYSHIRSQIQYEISLLSENLQKAEESTLKISILSSYIIPEISRSDHQNSLFNLANSVRGSVKELVTLTLNFWSIDISSLPSDKERRDDRFQLNEEKPLPTNNISNLRLQLFNSSNSDPTISNALLRKLTKENLKGTYRDLVRTIDRIDDFIPSSKELKKRNTLTVKDISWLLFNVKEMFMEGLITQEDRSAIKKMIIENKISKEEILELDSKEVKQIMLEKIRPFNYQVRGRCNTYGPGGKTQKSS